MASLPDRPDLHQLRIQAKELKRALAERDPSALDRLLTHHPKFAGRPIERAAHWVFTLRDAQVIIARETGFDSWKDLAKAIEGDSVRRFSPGADHKLSQRAFREAEKTRTGYVSQEHFLLALLNPEQPTIASAVLADLGLTYDVVLERVRKWSRPRRRKGTSSSQSYQLVLGWTQGIAVGLGSANVNDEIALLGLAYGTIGDRTLLESFDIDGDEVIDSLKARGVKTPLLAPPIPTRVIGPGGPFVYVPFDDFAAVSELLGSEYPPGRAEWGWNVSKWKKGHVYFEGEDEIPMVDVVRRALRGKRTDTIEVLSSFDGLQLESARAPRRYRDRPKP